MDLLSGGEYLKSNPSSLACFGLALLGDRCRKGFADAECSKHDAEASRGGDRRDTFAGLLDSLGLSDAERTSLLRVRVDTMLMFDMPAMI